MISGRLRHRITLQRPADDRDRSGEVTSEWVDFAVNVPASIEPLSSREFFAANQVQSEVSCRIRMRWIPGVHERMRVVHMQNEFSPPEAEIFDIEGAPIVDPTLRREILLYVRRRSTKGFRE